MAILEPSSEKYFLAFLLILIFFVGPGCEHVGSEEVKFIRELSSSAVQRKYLAFRRVNEKIPWPTRGAMFLEILESGKPPIFEVKLLEVQEHLGSCQILEKNGVKKLH